LYQEGACGALAKLDNVLPDEQRREVAWARQAVLAIGTNWADPNVSVPYLERFGLAAWIIGYSSSEQKGKAELKTRFRADELLTNVMIYWVTQTINSAAGAYYANAHVARGGALEQSRSVPAAVANCPYDPPLPREWAVRQVNLVHFTDFPRGGHFMAWEEPELYDKDLQDFMCKLRR
jgi:pimeloyl-ACP methyl ester carboxylesterase